MQMIIWRSWTLANDHPEYFLPKNLACGGPIPLRERPQICLKKIGVFVINKVKKGPKSPLDGPKRAKTRLKRAKMGILGPKIPVFCGIGGYPIPPCVNLFGIEGSPPLFAEKIR